MSSSEKGIDVPALSKGRKGLLLAIFCLAQFMDTFNSSALFPSIIDTSASLDMSPNDAVWIFAAYQAPFAAFLLISGRVSDVYSASKPSSHFSPRRSGIDRIIPIRMDFYDRRWGPRCLFAWRRIRA